MIAQYWQDLVTTALLGTDRRDPPAPPPGQMADLAADTGSSADAGSAAMLRQVGAATAARRAAFVAAAADVAVPVVERDLRPLTPAGAKAAFDEVIREFPQMLSEWLEAVEAGGWRLGPELVVPVLIAARQRPELAEVAGRVTGPLGPWLVEHWFALAPRPRKQGPAVSVDERLPVTAELDALLADPARAAAAIVHGLTTGAFGASHRPVLVNFVARLSPGELAGFAEALWRCEVPAPRQPLVMQLASLAEIRREALGVLSAPPPPNTAETQ